MISFCDIFGFLERVIHDQVGAAAQAAGLGPHARRAPVAAGRVGLTSVAARAVALRAAVLVGAGLAPTARAAQREREHAHEREEPPA